MWFQLRFLFFIATGMQINGQWNMEKFTSIAISQYFSDCLVTQVTSGTDAFSLHIENPVISLNLESSETSIIFYNKYTTDCNVIVSSIKYQQGFEETFAAKLTPSVNPISKRDKHFYFFLCSKASNCDTLTESKLSKHLRYKFLIQQAANEDISLNHMHPYLQNVPSFKINSDNSLPSVNTLFPDNTRNLYGHTLRVTAPTKYYGAYEMHKVDGRYRHKRGYRYVLFNSVMTKLNATYSLHPCSSFGSIKEGASGILLSNGTWAGCMGDILRDVSDISLIFSPSLSRHGHVDFSSAADYSWITFMIRIPEPEYTWRIVFTALSVSVWLIILITLLLATVFMTAMDAVVKSHQRHHSTAHELFMRGLYLFSYLLGQDGHAPNSKSAKCLFVSWLAYGLVIGTAYASSLQSLIVSPGLSIIPKTFLELVQAQDRFTWGASRDFQYGLGEQLFKNSKIPIMRSIYKNMVASETNLDCLLKAYQSNYGCFDWVRAHSFTQSAKLGNREIGIQYATDATFFLALTDITRKYETFRSHFNNFYARAFDTGLQKEALNIDWAEYRKHYLDESSKSGSEPVQYPTSDGGPKALKLAAVLGCYMLFLIGVILSCTALLVEFYTVINVAKILKL